MPGSILLIGGVGYVGYNLALHYSSYGYKVIVTGRASSILKRPNIAAKLKASGAFLHEIESPGMLESAFERKQIKCPDIAYILIGRLRGSKAELWNSNYSAVIDYANTLWRKCDSTRLVFTSAIAVYGKNAPRRCGEPVVEEREHCTCCQPRSEYSKAKKAAEKKLLQMANEYNSELVIARMGFFAGARPYHPEWRILLKLARYGFYVHSNILLNLSTAETLASHARNPPQNRAWVNAITAITTLTELHRQIASTIGKRAIALPLPGRRFSRFISYSPGLLGDIGWSFYSRVGSRYSGANMRSSIEVIVKQLVSEPPQP